MRLKAKDWPHDPREDGGTKSRKLSGRWAWLRKKFLSTKYFEGGVSPSTNWMEYMAMAVSLAYLKMQV